KRPTRAGWRAAKIPRNAGRSVVDRLVHHVLPGRAGAHMGTRTIVVAIGVGLACGAWGCAAAPVDDGSLTDGTKPAKHRTADDGEGDETPTLAGGSESGSANGGGAAGGEGAALGGSGSGG